MNNTSNVEVAALGTCNIDFIMKVPRFSIADDEVDVENMTVSLVDQHLTSRLGFLG